MKKLFILILIISFYCCNSINKESQDKKIFDSFIGLSKDEIVKTLGKAYSFSYEKTYDNNGDERDNFYIYTYNKIRFYSSYSDRDKPIYISTSNRNFTIFNFFNEVSFIIKDDYCIDWQALNNLK